MATLVVALTWSKPHSFFLVSHGRSGLLLTLTSSAPMTAELGTQLLGSIAW